MKKVILLSVLTAGLLVGCGGPEMTDAQAYDLKKLQMQQEHERAMARINTGQEGQVPVNAPRIQEQPLYSEPVNYGAAPQQGQSSEDEGYGAGSMMLAAAGGALAGYAMSELLDDGYRSYTNDKGHKVYVDKSGKQIPASQYEDYKKKHPTRHALSQKNQQAKAVVNTGKEKTVQAGQTVKQKGVAVTNQVKQKTSTFRSSSSKPSSRRR